jgi:hypothetical protein
LYVTPIIISKLAQNHNHHHLADPSCVFLPPKSPNRPAANLINNIAAALATRFNVHIATVRPFLDTALIEEWGKIRRVDSDAGDTMHASSIGTIRDDSRDATYVRVWLFDSRLRCLMSLPICYSTRFLLTCLHDKSVTSRNMSCRLSTGDYNTCLLCGLPQLVKLSVSMVQQP